MKKLVYAITGANGQLGLFVIKYLRNLGHTVYELVRSPEKAKDKNYYIYFDLSNPDKMPSLRDVDVLVHAAYFFDTTNKNYQKINIDGTEKLFSQAKVDQVKYSIFISTVSAHGQAVSLYGRTKFQLEQLLRLEYQANIIRPGLIFHQPLQGITASIDNFVNSFSIVPLIGSGKQKIYPCLLENLAEAIYQLSLKQPTLKKPLIAASEKNITLKQLVRYFAKIRKKNILLLPVPFNVIYLLLVAAESFRLPLGLRSDSILGIQYSDVDFDFSETRMLGVQFKELNGE